MLETAKARLDAYDEEHKRWLVVPIDGEKIADGLRPAAVRWLVWRRTADSTHANAAVGFAGMNAEDLSYPTKEEAECVMRVLRDQAAGRYLN